jgi:cytochrome d ubiquinol oxidase subunit II
VAVGNALHGVPFHFDDSLRLIYEGGLIGLLNPYALLCGLVSLAMLAMHGGAYLAAKAEEPVAGRARQAVLLGGLALILLFALAGVWTNASEGYRITGVLAHDGPSNPLGKTAEHAAGAWLANYGAMPWALLAPILGFAGALLAIGFSRARRDGLAWVASALSVAGVVATAGVSMFPFILPSSLDPSSSLTVWDASSSRTTLLVMLVAALIFVPIILAYTAFVYRVLRGRVGQRQIEADHSSY